MKTELQKKLAAICPSISISTRWEHDDYAGNINDDCDGDFNPNDWQAWQSEIVATVICDGRELTGSDCLCGTWESGGDYPWISNPDISGYENDMTIVALESLSGLIESQALINEINSAISFISNLIQSNPI